MGGVMSDSRLPSLTDKPSTNTENELSWRITSVYKCVSLSGGRCKHRTTSTDNTCETMQRCRIRTVLNGWCVCHVLLLPFFRNGVLVAQDEMDFVRAATLVRAKHDDVRRVGVKLPRIKPRGGLQYLQISTATLQSLRKAHLVSARECAVWKHGSKRPKP